MFNNNTLERDIERLGREIAERKNLPENQKVPERELVKRAIAPVILQAQNKSQTDEKKEPEESRALPEYLKEIPEEIKIKVKDLINEVFNKGLVKTVQEAAKADPFVLDAFHDALTDKLFEELKARKII